MNRHFIHTLAVEPLGAPIRQEPVKPSPETPWKPCSGHPEYLERINPQGIREVTHKDHVPPPSVVMPEDVHGDESALKAPAEWQGGPPPSVGWYDSYAYAAKHEVPSLYMVSYWDGTSWTHNSGAGNGREGVVTDGGWCSVWRGPRLTGADWPEPQS